MLEFVYKHTMIDDNIYYFLFILLQLNNDDIFIINQPYFGYIIVNQTLDFESMYAKNDLTYTLNISATVSKKAFSTANASTEMDINLIFTIFKLNEKYF